MNDLCICASEDAQMHTKSGVDPGSSLSCTSKDAQMHKCTLIDFDGTPSHCQSDILRADRTISVLDVIIESGAFMFSTSCVTVTFLSAHESGVAAHSDSEVLCYIER